ncbi:hypothetical protein [uncultured Pigmentiphaga sp.]|jgi:hypothetical protein|uniref:hypothetical protein n=1 Tax=uncultured Pigmentiphaga sp. TaxID=340361 RepID=UPI00261EB70B|nr:hypothetical protein [uncultured Pigmentiphaga sp.]
MSVPRSFGALRRQAGQSAVEYIVLAAAVIALAGLGFLGEGGGLLGWLLDALAGFHRRFAASVAMPL